MLRFSIISLTVWLVGVRLSFFSRRFLFAAALPIAKFNKGKIAWLFICHFPTGTWRSKKKVRRRCRWNLLTNEILRSNGTGKLCNLQGHGEPHRKLKLLLQKGTYELGPYQTRNTKNDEIILPEILESSCLHSLAPLLQYGEIFKFHLNAPCFDSSHLRGNFCLCAISSRLYPSRTPEMDGPAEMVLVYAKEMNFLECCCWHTVGKKLASLR